MTQSFRSSCGKDIRHCTVLELKSCEFKFIWKTCHNEEKTFNYAIRTKRQSKIDKKFKKNYLV